MSVQIHISPFWLEYPVYNQLQFASPHSEFFQVFHTVKPIFFKSPLMRKWSNDHWATRQHTKHCISLAPSLRRRWTEGVTDTLRLHNTTARLTENAVTDKEERELWISTQMTEKHCILTIWHQLCVLVCYYRNTITAQEWLQKSF